MGLDDFYAGMASQEGDELKRRQAEVTYNLHNSYHDNPAEVAENLRLQKSTGIPANLMKDKVVRDDAARQNYLNGINLSNAPATVDFLRDPTNAALSKDDVPNMTEFEGKTRTLSGTAKDIGITALKGAIGLPQAFVGLADIPTRGYAGKMLENLGYRPNEAQQILDEFYSPAQQAANLEVNKAEGFVGTAEAAIQNPSVIGHTILESLPSMVGGGAIGRGALKFAPKLAPVVAAAIGEGAISAGQAAEQIRAESKSGLLTAGQSGAALSAGTGTALLSVLGGKVAQKFGIADVDVLLTGKGASAGTKKMLGKRVLEGMVSEGLLEELPQSIQEQMWQNVATSRPVFEGVPQAAVLGMFAGMVMGGGANIVSVSPKTAAEQQNAALVDTLATAEASRLKANSPESFADFAQRVGEQHGVGSVYLQANRAIEEAFKAGITEEQMPAWFAQYGVSEAELTTAIQTGGMVQFNIGNVSEAFGRDTALQGLVNDMMVSPEVGSVNEAQQATEEEAAHMAKLAEMYDAEQANKISQEDIAAWEDALLNTPGLKGRVTTESLMPLISRANALSMLTGQPAIQHLNRMLEPTGLTTMKLKDFRELYGSAGEEIGQPQELGQGGRTVIYHGTTEEAAAQIEEAGFDVSKSADGSIWFTSNPQIGEVAASGKGAVVKRAFDESNLKLAGWEESDKYSTDELIAMGYDGLRLEDGDETTYQIFHPDKLEKVSEAIAQSDRPFDGPDIAKTPLPEGATTIEVDGVERPALNSEGRPIHPTVEGIKNFWRWFGDSKVVDGQGRPLVVYHGTNSTFSEFDSSKLGEETFSNANDIAYASTSKVGFWFNDGSIKSSKAAPYRSYMEVYLALEGPVDYYSLEELAEELRPYVEKWDDVEWQDQNPDVSFADLIAEWKTDTFNPGVDGLLVEDEEFGGTSYVAFSPTQIKSATGNRGTFDPNNPSILMQSNRPFEAAKQRLSVLHSLSSDNLLFADKMGGLAVPSLAVVPEGVPMSGFGDITLIGTKELADPERVPVFDADAYSATFPSPIYPKVAMKKAQKVVDYFEPFVEKFDSSRSILDTIWDNAVNRPDPARVLRDLADNNAAKAAFLASKGTDIGPVMRDKPLRYPWMSQPSWKSFADALEKRPNYNEELLLKAGEVVRQAVEEYLGTRAGADEKLNALLREAELSQVLDEKGAMHFGPFDRAVSETRDLGKQELDRYATREKLDEALKGHEAEFKSWLDDKILSMYGAPTLKVGGKKAPYTLDNIVKVMAAGRVQGKEQTMTFGEGQVRAAASKRFAGLEEMRGAAKDILPPKDIEAAREEAKKLGEEFRGAVLEYFALKDWRGEVDTWEGLDSSMRAIARWAKTKRTAADLAAALRKEDFRDVPKDVLELGVEFGNALLTAPVPYFEAKPQRAVSLDEFAGAVVPSSAGEEVKATLDKHGIPYAVYDESDETARATAVDQLRTRLAQQGAMTLFQSAWHGSPHTFDKFSTSAIGTGEGAQAYGYGLYFASSKEVAEFYRDKLSRDNGTIVRRLLDAINNVGVNTDTLPMDAFYLFAGEYAYNKGDMAATLKTVRENIRLYESDGQHEEADALNAVKAVVERAAANGADFPLVSQGRLYKVELAPEEDEYLLWDKPLSEQSEKVKEALNVEDSPLVKKFIHYRNELLSKYGKKFIKLWNQQEKETYYSLRRIAGEDRVSLYLKDGRVIYEEFASKRGSDKAASEYLHSLGIRGIKYLDGTSRNAGEGNYNYVIFSDDDVAITEMYQAMQNSDPLAVLAIQDGRNLIALFEKADKSSFLHETAHIFLNDLKYVAENMGVQTKEWGEVKEWLGVGDDGQITVDMHEKFAEHFEVYLRKGEAPSLALRDAFRKFKRWLTAIYESAKSARFGQREGVTVSPELQGLFDRLLATEQEIKAAREQAALVSLLNDSLLKDLGATKEQIDEYRNVSQQGEDAATEKRDKYKLNDRDARLKDWRDQAEKESRDIPVYGFTMAMSKAGGLDRQSIVKQFGADNIPDLPHLWRKDGADVNVAVAENGEAHGYQTAADFVDDLRRMKPRKLWIDQRVAQLETVYDNAQDTQEAIRTAALRRAMEIESEWLAKKAVSAQPASRAAMKAWAEGVVNGRTMRQIKNVGPLLTVSRKHRQAAIVAVMEGRWDDALKSNEQARLTEELITASYRAAKQWQAMESRWGRIAKWTNDNKSVKVGTAYRDQINRVLDQYGIAKKEYDPAAPDLHSFVASQTNGDLEEVSQVALGEWIGIQTADHKTLPWERLKDLGDALDYLYGHGREEVEGMKTAKGVKISDLADEIIARQAGIPNLRELASDATAGGAIVQAVQKKYRKFFAETAILRFIAQRLDGYKNVGGKHALGPAEQLVQDVVVGMTKSNDMWAAISAKIEPQLKLLMEDTGAKFSNLPWPEAMKKRGEAWNKERVVAACLNMGNASNLQRLMDGYGLKIDDVRAIQSKLTSKEWAAVQEIWKTIDSLWPQIADVHERINYFRPKKIEAQRFEAVTRDGKIVQMDGGYYPVGYDKTKDLKVAEWAEKDDILSSHENIMQVPVAKSGFTNNRAKKTFRPINLSLSVLSTHFNDTIRYISLAEAVRDADRVFRNKKLVERNVDTIGLDMQKMIRPTLKQVIRPDVNDLGFLGNLRSKMSIYYMGWNFWTALQNITGVFPAIYQAGLGNYLNGIYHTMKTGNPYDAYKAMLEASGYMRLRASNIERDMKTQIRNFSSGKMNADGLIDKAGELSFIAMRLVDTVVSLPTWWGVYNDQIAKTGNIKASTEAADAAINKALGSGLAIDATEISRHRFLSLLAPFMSFASVQQEVLATEREAWKKGQMSTPDFFYGQMMTWVFPAVASTFLQGVLMYGLAGALGMGGDDKRQKDAEDYLTDLVSYRLMGIPFVRDIYNAVLQGREHKAPITAARMPVTEAFKMIQDFSYRVGNWDGSEKTTKAMMWSAAELTSLYTNVPATRAYERWQKGQEDIENREGWWMNHLIPQERKK